MMIHPAPLVEILQTCDACPSEWSAWDASGNWYYLHYRSGYGSVHISAGGPPRGSEDAEFVAALAGAKLLTEFWYGGQYDAEITLDRFLALANLRVRT